MCVCGINGIGGAIKSLRLLNKLQRMIHRMYHRAHNTRRKYKENGFF